MQSEHLVDEPIRPELQGSLVAPCTLPETLDLSIITPLYNQLPLTRQFIESAIASIPPSISFEIILIDDCSTDGTQEFLKQLQPPCKAILSTVKGNYAINNNRGALQARGRVLALLNNDTLLPNGWLQPMLKLLAASPQTGAVGNIHENPATGLIDHAGVAFSPDAQTFHRYKNRKARPKGPYQAVNAISTACMLIRRETYFALGGFDESYINGSEDIDFCIRLRLSGYRIYISHESTIFHYVSSSPGRFKHDDTNRRRLREKWKPIMLKWAEEEWPSAYLARYARHFWKMNPKHGCSAALKYILQCLKSKSST